MEAATLDGTPSKPSNVTVNCTSGFMVLTWDPPEKPNAEIKGYTVSNQIDQIYVFTRISFKKSENKKRFMKQIQITHRFRGFKLTFAGWSKFSLIEELTYETDV
jgi:hypothetical protein